MYDLKSDCYFKLERKVCSKLLKMVYILTLLLLTLSAFHRQQHQIEQPNFDNKQMREIRQMRQIRIDDHEINKLHFIKKMKSKFDQDFVSILHDEDINLYYNECKYHCNVYGEYGEYGYTLNNETRWKCKQRARQERWTNHINHINNG